MGVVTSISGGRGRGNEPFGQNPDPDGFTVSPLPTGIAPLLCRRILGLLPTRKGKGDLLEEALDVVARLGRGLDRKDVHVLGHLVKLFRCHLPLVVEVRLVSDEDNDDIRTSLVPDVVDPLGRVDKRGAICRRRRPRSVMMAL